MRPAPLALATAVAAAVAPGLGCNVILGLGDVQIARDGQPGDVDARPSAGLHGTSTITWVRADGESTAPEDLSRYTIRALVRDDAAPGGFRAVAGAGAADGTFAIPAELGADTYVELTRPGTPTHALFHVDRAELDAGFTSVGHAGPAQAATTTVVLTVDGLTPWAGGDNFAMTSLGAGVELDPAYGWTGQPAIGATSATTPTFDWSQAHVADAGATAPRLLDPGRGDELRIAHTHQDSVTDAAGATASLAHIVDAATVGTATIADGATNPVTATLAPVAADRHQDLAIDLTAWFAADATRTQVAVLCDRDVGPAADRGIALGLPVFELSATVDAAAKVRTFRGLAFGDPLPAGLPAMIRCDAFGTQTVNTAAGPLHFAVHDMVDLAAAAVVTARPTLPAPTDATFGGVAFATGGTITVDGKTPLHVAWTGSAFASQYQVVVRAYDMARTPPVTIVATVDTTATSVDLPLDVVGPGATYVVSVWAVKATGGLATGELRRVDGLAERAQLLSQAFVLQ